MSVMNLNEAPLYTERGGTVRLLVTPKTVGSQNLILTHLTLQPGEEFVRHTHEVSEEAYYILAGGGEMNLEGRVFPVQPGEAVYIPPGTEHSLANHGEEPLVLLVTQAPRDEALKRVFG
ncbi:MAG TPA: cupin domain-containing protein [Armatimonadetes bacterium]|nr:cupin domain-containing protein [Armatimonadota bacterium]